MRGKEISLYQENYYLNKTKQKTCGRPWKWALSHASLLEKLYDQAVWANSIKKPVCVHGLMWTLTLCILLVWIFYSLFVCSVLSGSYKENRTLGFFDKNPFSPHAKPLVESPCADCSKIPLSIPHLHFMRQSGMLSLTSMGKWVKFQVKCDFILQQNPKPKWLRLFFQSYRAWH